MKMNILGRRILAFGLVLVIITANLASVSFAEDSAPVQEEMVTVSETVSPEPTASVPVESAPAASAAPTQPTESVPVASMTPTQPTASAPVASVTPTQPTKSAPVASVTPTQLTESTPVASEKPSQSTAAAPVASEVPIQPVTSAPVASEVPTQPTVSTPVASDMPVKPSNSPELALPEVSPSASPENSHPEVSPDVNDDATEACTRGAEDGVHEASCAFYVPTFLELLLSTETLKELHDAIMEDEEAAKALTAEELLKVKEYAEKLFEDIQEPAKDEEAYLELILETIVYLQELLEETVEEEPLELLEESLDGKYYYFDLFAGNLKINGNGGTTTLTGYRYDGQTEPQQITVSITGNEKVYVYVYQSNHVTDYTQTGIIDNALEIPEPTRVSGWGSYITNNTNVESVISSWNAKGRPSTPNCIEVTGHINCELVLDNIFSTYQTKSVSRTTGGISFYTSANDTNSCLTLKLKGDNRFGNIYYNGLTSWGKKIIFENFSGQSTTGTLTVANVSSNQSTNYWCAAIGGNDNGSINESSDGIVINSGIIFAGTNAGDDCTAIGGGGNGYGGVTINGGAVTAVVTSSGAAIGGGIGKTSTGGPATVNITGGTIYAYNFSCTSTYSQKDVKYIPAAAIGGGSSARQKCNESTINISGGYIYAQSVGGTAIGGGSSADNDGGNSVINITGGVIEAYSIPGTISGQSVPAGVAIGGGTGYNKGGTATLNVSNNAVLRTGSIGGGGYGDKNNADNIPGVIGFAQVTITGGNIRGQVVMEGEGSFLHMNGGTINNAKEANVNYSNCHFVKENGGAACVETGTVSISGAALIQNASAKLGGAIYLSNGNVTMTNGSIMNCTADFGGAVYVTGGNFTMSGGTIDGNSATAQNGEGGAAYVTGGNIYIGTEACTDAACLTVSKNTAVNGGAFAVAGATPVMYCGTVTGNCALEKGGALYVSGQGGFAMYGGVIDGGTVEMNARFGGGVYLASGTFTLSGNNASVQCNNATNGAGVYLAGGLPDLKAGALKNNTATDDGGGIYIDKQLVNLKPTGLVSITGNSADRGAGIFIAGTEGKTDSDAGFSVDAESVGTVELSSNTATADGGGVCISNGYFTLGASNIILQNNEAVRGGAVAVLSGNFTMSDGEIGASGKGNSADNGGGVYVSGGSVAVSGGTVQHNAATDGAGIYVQGGAVHISENGTILSNISSLNGGGICVNNGRIIMSGGRVSNNSAKSGEGGGMYVSSSGTNDVSVTVFSGEVSGNNAAMNGGAVAVRGDRGNILVQIGVNESHQNMPFSHTSEGVAYDHASCPVISNNLAGISGGAFYISGNATTQLNLYCLTDSGNVASGDRIALNENMSTFMMVEGGKVYLSTSQGYDGIAGEERPGDGKDEFGDMTVLGTIHVVSGVLELFGTKYNPRLEGALTIDLTDDSDFYYDHRTSKGKVTISYHENFHDAYGNIDSTQTAFDLDDKETHKIYSGLYAHEGYELYGWNTNANAVADITPDGWYDVNAVYTFHALAEGESAHTEGMNRYGDLTVYAIWKANGYWVEFNSGVPENEEWYGEMEDMHCKYNVPQEYPQNRFVRPGYKFVGWKEPRGTVKQPGEELLNLTSKQEERVIVTAMWEKCEHPNDEAAYSVNDTGDVMTKTCTLCGLTATAILSAQDTVYNGDKHEAKLEIVCMEEKFWEPDIQYSAAPLTAQEPSKWVPKVIPQDKMCINAAIYTAKIEEGGAYIQVTYTIAKAEKPAPTAQPTYDPPANGSNTLKIYQIPVEQQELSGQYENARVEYIVRHYEGNKSVEEIVQWKEGNTLTHELASGLNVYSVLARYEETDNYLPSKTVSANFPFLFEDGFILYIKADIGILAEQGFNDTAKTIKLSLEDGYYLLDGDYKFEVREVQEGDVSAEQWAQIKEYPDGHNYIECSFKAGILSVSTTDDATRDKNETYIATLEIGTTGKAPEIKNSKIKEKQHLSDFAGDMNPVISRDSAFTVYYEIKDFDDEHYQNPMLTFNQTLPSGTTIILRDRTDGRYWYFNASTSFAEVSLNQFQSMGSNPQSYNAENKDLKLQFIVDFSRAQNTIGVDVLTVNLEIRRKVVESVFVPELKSQDLVVGLGGVSISASKGDQISSLVNAITVTASANGGASKYDHRDLALVLEATGETELPIDASIRMNRDGVNSVWRQQNDGKIIISLGDFRNMRSDIKLELYSDMFPKQNEDVVYKMKASLYVSSSDADAAPLLGDCFGSVELSFTNNLEETGVSVRVDDDKRLFGVNDTTIQAVITTEPVAYTDNYYVKVELHQEFPDGSYGNTLIRPTVDNGTYTFDLNDCVDGDYCIVAFLTTKNDYVVSESRHYFIIDKTGD